MLVKTESLRLLLQHEDMSSEDILTIFWERDRNIFSLIPRENFKVCRWADLRDTPYGVMSYQWKSNWHAILRFILYSIDRVLEEYMWIDVFCLNQVNQSRMKTVRRSDEIYYHAKGYHLIEIGSLFRGWVLFELSSVSETLLPPKTHVATKDAALIDMAKHHLSTLGFHGCKFTEESDRKIVENKIIDKYGSVDAFNQKIIAIVNKVFV